MWADAVTNVRAGWYKIFVNGIQQTGRTSISGTDSASVLSQGSYMGGSYDIDIKAEASATRLAGRQTAKLTNYAQGSFQHNSSTFDPFDPGVGFTEINFFDRTLSPASLRSAWTDTLTIAGTGDAFLTFTYELTGSFSDYAMPGLGLTYFNDGFLSVGLSTVGQGALNPVAGSAFTTIGNAYPRSPLYSELPVSLPSTVSVTYLVPRGEALQYRASMQMNSTVVDSVWDPTFTNLYMLASAGYNVDMFFDMGHTIRLVDLGLTDTSGNDLPSSLLSSASGAAYPTASVPEAGAISISVVAVLFAAARRRRSA
ncbi:hypothetical protein F183_A09540 [Bryobacterales bacterium F-183]|nr:hypothetical protein F183_A09540 [Bryobacterales bacterium F-183]